MVYDSTVHHFKKPRHYLNLSKFYNLAQIFFLATFQAIPIQLVMRFNKGSEGSIFNFLQKLVVLRINT